MNESFAVPRLDAFSAIDPENARIVFHGINKSGSWAMATTLRDAYAAAGREQEFQCHYFLGGPYEAFARRVGSSTGPGFFVGHSLYGALRPDPGRVWVTVFRHPLPRILSCYQWLKNKHQDEKPNKPYPPLAEWIRARAGKGHSLVTQFGAGFGRNANSLRKRLTPHDFYQLSVDALERDVLCIGLAECFEESIFLFASLAGLPAVAPWERDQRNPGRPLSSEISDEDRAVIEEVYRYDFKLYDYAVRRFRAQLESARFGPALESYKARCEGQYNDRLIVA